MFEGTIYEEARNIPEEVARRIRKLIVTDVAHCFPDESTTDQYGYNEDQILELTFTAFDRTNDEEKQSDVRLIVSNSHNGYYSHDVIATYNGQTFTDSL